MMKSTRWRDCLEIWCVESNSNFSSESVVVNIGKVLDLDINVNDISIAYPLPNCSSEALPKIIVKFTRRDLRNAFCCKRKELPDLKPSQRPDLNGFIVGENIYISESLTEGRKRLYGAINRFRKSINWTFIWSQNGWIYIRKDKTANIRSYLYSTMKVLKISRSAFSVAELVDPCCQVFCFFF